MNVADFRAVDNFEQSGLSQVEQWLSTILMIAKMAILRH